MALAAKIEIEKEQELRRIRLAETQADLDVSALDKIVVNLESGKERLIPHAEVMEMLAKRGKR